jgi:glycosyltransferase involved in cell wall biosynthesis
MPTAVLIVPGSLETRTGGYEYDRRVVGGLRSLGWAIDIRELDPSFPRSTATAFSHADRVLAQLPAGAIVMIDGLAFGAMPEQAERESNRLSIVPIVHSLLASDVGLDAESAAWFAASERRAYTSAAHVVAAGESLIDPLVHYGIDRSRITVVEPGTDPAPLARGSGDAAIVHMITVATLNPGKGHDVLFNALAAAAPSRNWRLTCAGSTTRYPETTTRLRSILADRRLTDRVTLTGELDRAAVAELYDRADLFVLPSLRETYPLAVMEALARGLPVIGTAVGAIPHLVGDTAGVLVPPGDVGTLAAALDRVLRDHEHRARLTRGAQLVRDRLPTWDTTAQAMASVLERLRYGRVTA